MVNHRYTTYNPSFQISLLPSPTQESSNSGHPLLSKTGWDKTLNTRRFRDHRDRKTATYYSTFPIEEQRWEILQRSATVQGKTRFCQPSDQQILGRVFSLPDGVEFLACQMVSSLSSYKDHANEQTALGKAGLHDFGRSSDLIFRDSVMVGIRSHFPQCVFAGNRYGTNVEELHQTPSFSLPIT